MEVVCGDVEIVRWRDEKACLARKLSGGDSGHERPVTGNMGWNFRHYTLPTYHFTLHQSLRLSRCTGQKVKEHSKSLESQILIPQGCITFQRRLLIYFGFKMVSQKGQLCACDSPICIF